MKKLGWIFLIGYLIDAVVSTVASYVAAVVLPSGVFTLGMMVFSLFIFVFSARGKLLPKKVFFTLTLYYSVLVVFGLVLMALLIARLKFTEFIRLSKVSNSPSQLFRNEFAWFDAVNLPVLVVWLGLAIYGLVNYGKTINEVPATTNGDRTAN